MAKNLTRQIIHSASVAQNATEYTDVVTSHRSTGDAAILIVSSAGSITVTQQCSLDNIKWYDPVNGAGSALGAVVATMTVGSKYVVPSTVVAPFLRFKIVEGNVAATTVTITYSFAEDLNY